MGDADRARREAEEGRREAVEAALAARKGMRKTEGKYKELVHEVEREKKVRAIRTVVRFESHGRRS